jgi:hypothetical protein
MDLNAIKLNLLPLQGNKRSKIFRDLKNYVYVYCTITDDNKRIPIYIGKGKSDRCFQHLNNLTDSSSEKHRKIHDAILKNRLGIDILAYGLDDQTALIVESACIDLMGIENLTNTVRGQGNNVKRVQLGELSNLLTDKKIKVQPEHRGVAILINRDYRPSFGDLELFEITRGIWSAKMKTLSKDAIHAYATFHGVVKEVYEIHSWVPAGTQEYFTRGLNPERLENARWEFVGRKAPKDVRDIYVGKILDKPRSYGNPFMKVGFD